MSANFIHCRYKGNYCIIKLICGDQDLKKRVIKKGGIKYSADDKELE
jgi:hypothetical protein